MKNIKSNQNLITVLFIFSILAVALGNIGGCNGDGGGGTPFNLADLVRGGLLYDKWWAENGADEPTDTNPTYPTEVNPNHRTGSQTWRCKECHGWDYLGVEGAYGSGSHFTGIAGILDATEPQELFDIIADGTTGPTGTMTGYTEDQLSDEDIWDLVKFIKEGLIDDRNFINYQTKEAINPDLENGQARYNSVCAACHGFGGEAIEFDEGCIRELADDNPQEVFHKIRFGNPGTPMPSSIENGWTNEDVRDVLGYAQTLPPNCEGLPLPTPTPTPVVSPTPTPIVTPPPTPTPTPTPGAILYQDNCQVCHGPNGEGTAIAPNIQGKSASEIQNAIDTVGAMMGIDLTSEEIGAIADFLAQ